MVTGDAKKTSSSRHKIDARNEINKNVQHRQGLNRSKPDRDLTLKEKIDKSPIPNFDVIST